MTGNVAVLFGFCVWLVIYIMWSVNAATWLNTIRVRIVRYGVKRAQKLKEQGTTVDFHPPFAIMKVSGNRKGEPAGIRSAS